MKVGIFELYPVFVRGLIGILTSGGFEVVGSRPEPAYPLPWSADLLLADAGVVTTRFVAAVSRTVPILLFGDAAAEDQVARYRAAGAVGFLDRRCEPDRLLAAARTAIGGDSCWTVDPVGAPAASALVELSPREWQVLQAVAEGLTHHQVADRLGISENTVDTHVKRVRSKLDLRNKAELTRAALLGQQGR